MTILKFHSDEAKYSWLAGLIDGEGYLGISQHKDRKAKRQFSWRPQMRVINTNLTLLNEIRKQFLLGTISSAGKGDLKRKPVYQISFSSNHIREILPKIIPYLVIKQKQAHLLLKMLSITKDHRLKTYCLKEVDKKIDNLWVGIRELNHRGIRIV